MAGMTHISSGFFQRNVSQNGGCQQFRKIKKPDKTSRILIRRRVTNLQWGDTEFFNFNPFFWTKVSTIALPATHTVIETRRFLNSSEESKRNTRLGDHSFLSATDWNAKLNWKI
jgi:hypothetical protein